MTQNSETSSQTTKRDTFNLDDEISSKMAKTYISPPERFRRRTIKDDIRVAYTGEDMEKYGKRGRPQQLEGNMFKINIKPETSIHLYSAVFEPEIRFVPAKIRLVEKLKELGELFFFTGNVLFLPYKREEPIVVKVQSHPDRDPIQITFKYKSTVQNNTNDINNMLGSLVKRCITEMDLVPINRGLYLMSSKQPIENYKLDIIHGYQTTVLPHENDCLLTVNLSNKVMASGTVLHMMSDLARKHGPRSKDAMLRELIGKTVITRYNNKTYKIDDIDFKQSPVDTFEQRQKDRSIKQVSFAEYFHNMYNLKVRDMDQPLLISRKKKFSTQSRKSAVSQSEEQKGDSVTEDIIALIPEFCHMTGIPDEYFTDFRFKKAMQGLIRNSPDARRRALDEFINGFKTTKAHNIFDRWGFQLDARPVEIPARQLDQFTIEFANGAKVQSSNNIDMRRQKMFDTSKIMARWVVIHPSGNYNEANDFVKYIIRYGTDLGMTIRNPKVKEYTGDRNQHKGIAAILNSFRDFVPKADMIVLLQRNQNKDLYDFFKKETNLTMGVPSQVVLLKHFRNPKNLISILSKIAIQMQCKIGGAPWAITINHREIFMVVGMDTYHDSTQRGLSCCAAVASLNNTFTKYTWAVAMVQSKQEINTHMRSLFQSLLQTFIETNGTRPTKIIIFRDGVGEGQVSTIMEYEFSAMQQSILEVSPEAKIAFCTLSKRIESRFFAARGQNPRSGTVIDKVATHANQKDFYLIPLESRQGTVTPIHYRMHYSTFVPNNIDNFQYLAYLLCYMYFNWPGPIKVPSVCQYAHRCAFLVGNSLHAKPHQDMKSKLFFL